MQSYSTLAKYYDKLMGDFDYKGYVAFVKQRVQGSGIDLCCGSGKMTMALAHNNLKMIGVDISPEMLNVAMEKSKKEGLNILFINQDIVEFQPIHPVDFVICVCDGLNYISPQDLPQLIQKVSSYVKSGGHFIFDISTKYKLEKVLGNNIFCEDYDNITYIWSNSYDDDNNSLEMQVSFFEKKHGKIYERLDEYHLQYAHDVEYINNLLDKQWDYQVLDGEKYKAISKNSKRALWVCQKK